MLGDLNVAPLENDVWSHKQLLDVVSHTPVETRLLGDVLSAFDLTDVTRHFVPESEKIYTWWSYRAADWQAANKGRRLDHIWVTAPLRHKIAAVEVMTDVRHWQPPSDHVPVRAMFSF